MGNGAEACALVEEPSRDSIRTLIQSLPPRSAGLCAVRSDLQLFGDLLMLADLRSIAMSESAPEQHGKEVSRRPRLID